MFKVTNYKNFNFKIYETNTYTYIPNVYIINILTNFKRNCLQIMAVSTRRTLKNRSQSPENKCSVCLGDYKDKSYVPGCYHAFCFTCIKEWASRNNVCPLCKGSFDRIIHKVKSETNYKEYVINVTKRSDTQDDYPFIFSEHSFPPHGTFLSRLFRNNMHFHIVPPPTISTSTLFEQTRVLRSNTARSIVLSPISFSISRNSRSRRPSNTVTIISDDENDTETNEVSEVEVINMEDFSIVTSTPTPSTSGMHQSPPTSLQPITIDDSDDDEDASNATDSVIFVQESRSKKGKVSSKLKKKSSIDVAVQVGSTQQERSEETQRGDEYEADIEEDSQKIKDGKSNYIKTKPLPPQRKIKPESSSVSTDDDDLEVIQILSRKLKIKKPAGSAHTSTAKFNICGSVSSDSNGGDNDCIFLMSKNNNVARNNNVVDNNINSVAITDIHMDLNIGSNEIVENTNNIDTTIADIRENENNNIGENDKNEITNENSNIEKKGKHPLKRKNENKEVNTKTSKILKEE